MNSPRSHPPAPDALSGAACDAVWVDWLDGWYWQTDVNHRLVLLKPPAQAPQADWLLVRHWCDQPGPWWSAGAFEAALAQCTALEVGLKAGAGVDAVGPLSPHPASADAAVWQILGVPRRDAGGWVGHHGVWRKVAPLAGGECAAPPGAAGGLARMSGDEQEVLRYALSHDLRAPLRSVEGFSRILREDYGHLLDRIGNDHLERVLAAATRMGGMIDAILAQAQLSRTPLVKRSIDFSALVRDVAQDLDASGPALVAGSSRVRWLVAEGMQVRADADMLRRVLENLLGNAVKYSGKVLQPQVEVGVVPATDPQVLFVRDNGAGFDMQHADKLFGLFQRLHSTNDFPGSGVGLAGVQNIIQRHGGKVWAEAQPGRGACFYFTLNGTAR